MADQQLYVQETVVQNYAPDNIFKNYRIRRGHSFSIVSFALRISYNSIVYILFYFIYHEHILYLFIVYIQYQKLHRKLYFKNCTSWKYLNTYKTHKNK